MIDTAESPASEIDTRHCNTDTAPTPTGHGDASVCTMGNPPPCCRLHNIPEGILYTAKNKDS